MVARRPEATPNVRAEADLRGFTFHRQLPHDARLTDRRRPTLPQFPPALHQGTKVVGVPDHPGRINIDAGRPLLEM
jgi:hypothetical protein